jgi:valyl-tRNA synthetase
MDHSYWKKVQDTLLTFFDKGLIYRDEFPVHWCPKCETALAQAELGYVKKAGRLIYVKFPYEKRYVEIATTRPELIPACQALAVHPGDDRHSDLIGKEVEVPLFNKKIPIISDQKVDPEFGTGIVMICTFGDEQDIRWQQRYNLPITKVVDEKGYLLNSGQYSGLSISEARNKIVSDLSQAGLISKEEEISHRIMSHTERADCMSAIEFLVKKQWFIEIKSYKNEIIKASKEMKWIPDYMLQRLIDWVDSIEWDWLISRQRVYGTPLPFWYCLECDEIIPAIKDQIPVDPTKETPPIDKCPKCSSSEIKAAEEVCDCWVDSSITPLVISGFFEDEEYFKRAYPSTIRQQGYDIIRTWFFYTAMRCIALTEKPPFKGVLINGLILGPDGFGMSKSRGNVVSPTEHLEDYGADSLRQALLSLTIGSDFPFRWETVKYGRNFLQKYWSASRFASQFLKEFESSSPPPALTIIDKWILAKLVKTVNEVSESLSNYIFHNAIKAIQNYFWHDFCDQYLEAVKHRLYEKGEGSEAACYTLYTVLLNSTIIFAPICPHITEEIYHRLFRERLSTIHAEKWPDTTEIPFDPKAETEGDFIITIISTIRTQKSRSGIPLRETVPKIQVKAPRDKIPILQSVEEEVKKILHIEEILYQDSSEIEVEFL